MHNVKKLFSLNYYTDILAGKEKGRPFVFIFIISLIPTLFGTYEIIKTVLPFSSDLETKAISIIKEIYPAELTIEIKDGYASTNVTEPYFITVKKDFIDTMVDSSAKDLTTEGSMRLLAIDTKAKAEDLEQYQSLALLTQTSIVYYDDEEIKIFPIRDVDDITISQKFLTQTATDIINKFHLQTVMYVLLILLPFMLLFLFFIINLFSLLWNSLLGFIISRILEYPVTFGKIFSFITALTFVAEIVFMAFDRVPGINSYTDVKRSLFTLILLTFTYLIMKQTPRAQPNIPEPISDAETKV